MLATCFECMYVNKLYELYNKMTVIGDVVWKTVKNLNGSNVAVLQSGENLMQLQKLCLLLCADTCIICDFTCELILRTNLFDKNSKTVLCTQCQFGWEALSGKLCTQIGKWHVNVISETLEAEKKKAGQTDTVDSYEAAFKRIREITKEEDIDRIVRQFIEVEDENFAIFNFVGDQNNRIEYLQDEIDEVWWLSFIVEWPPQAVHGGSYYVFIMSQCPVPTWT